MNKPEISNKKGRLSPSRRPIASAQQPLFYYALSVPLSSGFDVLWPLLCAGEGWGWGGGGIDVILLYFIFFHFSFFSNIWFYFTSFARRKNTWGEKRKKPSCLCESLGEFLLQVNKTMLIYIIITSGCDSLFSLFVAAGSQRANCIATFTSRSMYSYIQYCDLLKAWTGMALK